MKKGRTWVFDAPAHILSFASVGGRKEGEGPLCDGFDILGEDNRFGEKTWEKAESRMVYLACKKAAEKAELPLSEIGCFLGGDLLDQCVSTAFALRELAIPTIGLYGACSTMAESLALGAALLEAKVEETALCAATSHFCSAERQYRFPLEYGGQRPQTSQWTATASGAVLLGKSGKVKISSATVGKIYDIGIKDANNMGAAMALAAYETIKTHFEDTKTKPSDYDLIVTGDLSAVGKEIVEKLFFKEGVDMSLVYNDCGLMLYYHNGQDVHAGGSGCGCSAAVLCAKILPDMKKGLYKRVLFCGTGALLSPLTVQQGESIPGICHAIGLEAEI